MESTPLLIPVSDLDMTFKVEGNVLTVSVTSKEPMVSKEYAAELKEKHFKNTYPGREVPDNL